MTKRTSLFPPEHRIEHDTYKAEIADDAFKNAVMDAGYTPRGTTVPGTDNPRPIASAIVPCGGSSAGF